ALRSLLDNKPAVALGIFQAPGSNALELSDRVRATMEELKQDFPEDVEYAIVYDPTKFVRESIKAVVHTLFEAIALVVLVVIVFLQTWRASIIPLLAVPVSIVGTFAFLLLMGFSINALSLFGLVLSIGIVVDDAIVVVENVERNIESGLSPKDATYQAMREVSGPIIAIALTLIAVFVPIAFISGLTGQFYRQFALTIAISTVISAFNSLTLSPAMAALLLKGHGEPPDAITRWMDKNFGNFFKRFNTFFHREADDYATKVGHVLGRKARALWLYGVLMALTGILFYMVPTGYIPPQDKQYLIGFAQLPDGSSLERTDQVLRRMSEIAMKNEGVLNAVSFPGLSINGFSVSSSAGIVFLPLKDFDERRPGIFTRIQQWLNAIPYLGHMIPPAADYSAQGISNSINMQFGAIQDAFLLVLPPPPVMGLGTTGGFRLQIQDRADLGDEALHGVVQAVTGRAYGTPGLFRPYSGFQINVPQLFVDIDRTRAKQLGVPINSIFTTMQAYLGSLYVNDFNRFGRTYQVIVQADAPYRAQPEDIGKLKVRSQYNEMIPLGSLVRIEQSYGPERAMRYNAYRTADINAEPAPGFSTGQAQAIMEKILKETLPKGMSYEWTDLTYQQILAGDSTIYVFPLCVLLVFLVLAAQYENLVLPLAVILIVPMSLFSAMFGVWVLGGDNNIFTQIGLMVLVGLACKNAILIVEFARELELTASMSPMQAAIQAARLRLRPILMTSFAFIMGVVPLVLSSGAGSEMRHAMGIAVFFGMLGVTFFGLFLTPVFYVGLRQLSHRKLHCHTSPPLHNDQESPHA
ncbi:MAG: multidrug efflux RND transporter permease subunit, partial [Proteobacteria bacterium]|nr:multidrug efflux RND transporter permease subunit [Pseudomonadota bacterium]